MPSNCPPLVGCGPGPWFVQHLWPIPCSECAVPSAFRTIQVLWAAVNKSSGQNSIAKMPNRKQGTCTEEQNSSPVWWSGQSSCKPGTVTWIWSLVCVWVGGGGWGGGIKECAIAPTLYPQTDLVMLHWQHLYYCTPRQDQHLSWTSQRTEPWHVQFAKEIEGNGKIPFSRLPGNLWQQQTTDNSWQKVDTYR